MRGLALFLLVALIAVSAAFLAFTAGQLPGVVASHFDSRSGVNGWLTRSQYMFWMLALAILLPGAIVGLIALLSRTAPRLINLPHRAYWLSEGRRKQTLATLLTFACALVAWTIALYVRSRHVD
jgi:hypothetical protein